MTEEIAGFQTSPKAQVQAAFEEIARRSMHDLSFLHPSMPVYVSDFTLFEGQWTGCVITPWMLSAVIFPGPDQLWRNPRERIAELRRGRPSSKRLVRATQLLNPGPHLYEETERSQERRVFSSRSMLQKLVEQRSHPIDRCAVGIDAAANARVQHTVRIRQVKPCFDCGGNHLPKPTRRPSVHELRAGSHQSFYGYWSHIGTDDARSTQGVSHGRV